MKVMRITLVLVALLALAATAAVAGDTGGFGGSGAFGSSGAFTPQVPVSSLARPNLLFDPSRLHLSTSVSVGSGFGNGANALQVTRLSYQFSAPLAMAVSVGNAWGPNTPRGANTMFLEGLDLSYRPFPSMLFQVHYQDLRSPLQYSNGFGVRDFWAR